MWLFLLALLGVMLIGGLLFGRFLPKKPPEFDPNVQQAREQAEVESQPHRFPPPSDRL